MVTALRGWKAGVSIDPEPGDLPARESSGRRGDVVELQLRSRSEAGRQLSVLVWRFDRPLRVAASAPHGGGLATRRWIVNAQVPPSYARRDPDHHLRKLAVSLGLPGHGVGMLTAADVRSFVTTLDGGVEVVATVRPREPEWAAAAPRPGPRVPGRPAGGIHLGALLAAPR